MGCCGSKAAAAAASATDDADARVVLAAGAALGFGTAAGAGAGTTSKTTTTTTIVTAPQTQTEQSELPVGLGPALASLAARTNDDAEAAKLARVRGLLEALAAVARSARDETRVGRRFAVETLRHLTRDDAVGQRAFAAQGVVDALVAAAGPASEADLAVDALKALGNVAHSPAVKARAFAHASVVPTCVARLAEPSTPDAVAEAAMGVLRNLAFDRANRRAMWESKRFLESATSWATRHPDSTTAFACMGLMCNFVDEKDMAVVMVRDAAVVGAVVAVIRAGVGSAVDAALYVLRGMSIADGDDGTPTTHAGVVDALVDRGAREDPQSSGNVALLTLLGLTKSVASQQRIVDNAPAMAKLVATSARVSVTAESLMLKIMAKDTYSLDILMGTSDVIGMLANGTIQPRPDPARMLAFVRTPGLMQLIATRASSAPIPDLAGKFLHLLAEFLWCGDCDEATVAAVSAEVVKTAPVLGQLIHGCAARVEDPMLGSKIGFGASVLGQQGAATVHLAAVSFEALRVLFGLYYNANARDAMIASDAVLRAVANAAVTHPEPRLRALATSLLRNLANYESGAKRLWAAHADALVEAVAKSLELAKAQSDTGAGLLHNLSRFVPKDVGAHGGAMQLLARHKHPYIACAVCNLADAGVEAAVALLPTDAATLRVVMDAVAAVPVEDGGGDAANPLGLGPDEALQAAAGLAVAPGNRAALASRVDMLSGALQFIREKRSTPRSSGAEDSGWERAEVFAERALERVRS